jgi:subtilisin family serine protease
LGATGKGVAIGIVDSGLDTSNPEFAGRISSASADVAGARGVDGEDSHGTIVALVAAAGRNGSGVMGIAYEATVMGLRADTPGSCATADGCTFGDVAIAAGIDRAVTNGAKVINLSLGGGDAGLKLRRAWSWWSPPATMPMSRSHRAIPTTPIPLPRAFAPPAMAT